MLIAIGISDVCRRLTVRVWVPVVVAPVVVIACAVLAGLWHLGDIALLVIAAAASVGWLLLCARAERTVEREAAPLLLFGLAVGLLIVLSGWGSEVDGLAAQWPSWAGFEVDPNRLLMVVAVVLLQLVTGNQLVRFVLGPMERLLILGLGLAGQLAAATAVVAAKSIIRFPGINARKARENGGIGIDEVTEFFLVGSFASLILALGGLALAQ
jgi:hypothetical protein